MAKAAPITSAALPRSALRVLDDAPERRLDLARVKVLLRPLQASLSVSGMTLLPPCHAFCPAGIANRVMGPPDPARKYARDLGVRYRPAFQNAKSPRFAAEKPCPRNSALPCRTGCR